MKRIHWTNDMEEFLEDKWGIWSVKRLAKHFNTTECAITNKAERLKLGGAYSQYLSTTDIANMFGIARRTVLNYWILKYGLKASWQPPGVCSSPHNNTNKPDWIFVHFCM